MKAAKGMTTVKVPAVKSGNAFKLGQKNTSGAVKAKKHGIKVSAPKW